MDESNKRADDSKRLSDMETRVMMCEAAGRAQVVMIKALIATHPHLDVLEQAFRDFSEGAVSRALGSAVSTDRAIAAFEFFRDEWLRMLKPAAG